MTDAFLQALEDRRLTRERERMVINKRLAQMNAEIEADAITKRTYLEMVSAGQLPAIQGEAKPSPVPDSIEAAPPIRAAAAAGEPMVKDMILAVLRDAAPAGLTAAQIKHKAFNKFRKHINPNTLTVSLGRYSKPKEGEPRLARCMGRVWYFIRQNDGPPMRAPELELVNGGMNAAE